MDKVSKTFAFHTPSEESKERIAQLRQGFSNLAESVKALVPKSREQSVALTEIETAAMWAIKGVVQNNPESIPE